MYSAVAEAPVPFKQNTFRLINAKLNLPIFILTSHICLLFSVGNRSRELVYQDERERLKKDIMESHGLAIHSDGKKLNEYGVTVERFPIVLSGFKNGQTYIVDVPKVVNGKGVTMAEANFKALEEVGAIPKLAVVVADTTPV